MKNIPEAEAAVGTKLLIVSKMDFNLKEMGKPFEFCYVINDLI